MPQQAIAQFCGTSAGAGNVLALVGLQKQKMVPETKQSLDQWNSP
jgi:hypothetical protein